MAENEPEYLCKFRQTLKAALEELPSAEEMITSSTQALIEARRTIRDYQYRCRILEFENKYLHRDLHRIKKTAEGTLE